MREDIVESKAVAEIKRLAAKHKITILELSSRIQVTGVRLYEILAGKRRVTPDTDIRLCKFFGMGRGYFAKLQLEHDLDMAERAMDDKDIIIKNIKDTIKAPKK